ncbi:MAG: hypothetical protein MJ166_08000 [Clostridia bacterium]|nr:hypothetical protein [Clostridia bacterium]
MKNKEKLNSDFNGAEDMFSSPASTVIDNASTDMDVFPDIILDGTDGNLTIVIHHDYYSSDSDHGRLLLAGFLEVLKDEFDNNSRIFVLDSGVKIFNSDHSINHLINDLCDLNFDIIVCKESLDNYGVDTAEYKKIRKLSIHDISLELLSAPYLFNLG